MMHHVLAMGSFVPEADVNNIQDVNKHVAGQC
ncbi:Uncharacterised protein [Serratia quinivorans]|nr:Uncharacterised protein [Serratia quinivorans]